MMLIFSYEVTAHIFEQKSLVCQGLKARIMHSRLSQISLLAISTFRANSLSVSMSVPSPKNIVVVGGGKFYFSKYNIFLFLR